MLEEIIYKIADQYLIIHTPAREKTIEIYSNYRPFLQDVLPDRAEVLMHVWGDEELSSEGLSLLEETSETYFSNKLYQSEGGAYFLDLTYFRLNAQASYSSDWKEVRCTASFTDPRFKPLLDKFVMIAFGMATIPLGMLKVHASVTELDGHALVFMGVSGTGKSTHSKLWREHVVGCTLLNDDEPIVRLMEDGSVRVYGCPWSGSTDCYRAEHADLVAFVHLYQSPENKLTKLSGLLAFESLFSSVASIESFPASSKRLLDTLVPVLNTVPVYRLDCRPDKEAVKLTYALLQPNKSLD